MSQEVKDLAEVIMIRMEFDQIKEGRKDGFLY